MNTASADQLPPDMTPPRREATRGEATRGEATRGEAAPPSSGRTGGGRRMSGPWWAGFFRWLHTYLSMFGFATILLFSVTGITLNHPEWFGERFRREERLTGQVELSWLQGETAETVDKLAIVEQLRSVHRLGGAVSEFRIDEFECFISWRGPGYSADAFVDRESGRYELTVTRHGLIAVLNDLHKGRDTGTGWSLAIDISALLMALSSLTGLVLLFYIRRRRASGLVTMAVGAAVLGAVYFWLVP